MHPNAAFRWPEEAAMRAFVTARGFATICVVAEGLPTVAHAPVVVTDAGALRFHVARGNRVTRHLDGANAVVSVTDADHYVSPDWYASVDQVPTWNYLSVEIEGQLSLLDHDALVGQLDTLSATHEAPLAAKSPWTRAKMTPGRFEAMLPAILCFELTPTEWRGTVKLSQNKSAADRTGVADGLSARGLSREAKLAGEGLPA